MAPPIGIVVDVEFAVGGDFTWNHPAADYYRGVIQSQRGETTIDFDNPKDYD